jgi:hypothetical protein
LNGVLADLLNEAARNCVYLQAVDRVVKINLSGGDEVSPRVAPSSEAINCTRRFVVGDCCLRHCG